MKNGHNMLLQGVHRGLRGTEFARFMKNACEGPQGVRKSHIRHHCTQKMS